MGVTRLFDWLVDGAPGAAAPTDVVTRIGAELLDEGIALDQLTSFVATLHPDVYGRMFTWTPGGAAQVEELSYTHTQSPAFATSPLAVVARDKRELRRRLDEPGGTRDFPQLAELAAAGYTDLVVLPMVFTTGEGHAFTLATRRPSGFRDDELAAFRHVVRPLARLAEILALRRTATNLLSTYVGRNAGDRVLAGRIKKGDIEDIRAVIWFSDLRGFTQLSQRASPRVVIDALNQAFDCQVAAVDRHGGEVLKFMGDGMLAIFPIAESIDAAATRAVQASRDAFTSLGALNATRAKLTEPPLRFGVALHVGEVAYGNIGGASRLDFTAIGPAVNLASRIEGLTGKLDKRVLLSEALAKACSAPTRAVGRFELKGVAGEQEVFELVTG